MSSYRGWDEAEMRPGMALKKRRLNTGEALTPSPILPSFAPFNQSSTIKFPVQKPVRALAPKMECRSIYDLPEDDVAMAQPLEIWRRKNPNTPPPANGSWSPLASLPVINAVSKLTTPPDSVLRNANRLRKPSNLVSDGVVKSPTLTPTNWTTNDILKGADFPCRQTTLEKLAAFRYEEPKERPAGRSHRLGGDGLKVLDVNTFNRDPGKMNWPSTETEATFNHGDKLTAEEATSPDDMQWQDISLLEDTASDILGVEEGSSQGSIQWKDHLPLQEDSDEFPMLDNEVAEMLHLQNLDSYNEVCFSSSTIQAQDEPDFQDHAASHDLPFPSPTSTSHTFTENISCKSSSLPNNPISHNREAEVEAEEEEEEIRSPENEDIHHHHHPSTIQALHPQINPNNKDDYTPLTRFARAPFPPKLTPRSPIVGLSNTNLLRTCFRIGEVLSRASLKSPPEETIIIELFARIKHSHSSPDSSSSSQNRSYEFEFRDLFHDGLPFLQGRLDKVRKGSLQETEGDGLVGVEAVGRMVRCLGRLSREGEGEGRWLRIVNVRGSDWEEVRWTRRIVNGGGGLV